MNAILKKIPDWFWTIFLPVGFVLLTLYVERAEGNQCFTSCEDGPVETVQALVMFIAFGVGLSVLRLSRGVYPRWAQIFLAIGVFGSLYVALEEISYGQRIFGWSTPETWLAVNDQQETNLHNTSSWFDQKPRLILEIGVFLGGIVVPALRRFKNEWLPKAYEIIYPSNALFTTALIAVLIRIYRDTTEFTHHQEWFYIDRGSELQEMYFYWFILLYFAFMRRKLKASSKSGQ